MRVPYAGGESSPILAVELPGPIRAIERESEERIELRDGYIYAMAGATPEDEQIVANRCRE